MGTTINLSLPEEQIQMLEKIHSQQQILINAANDQAWLTDEMLAKRFHCHINTLRRWRDESGLPFRQIGSVRLYIPKEVDNWMSKFSVSNVKTTMAMMKSNNINNFADA